MNPLKKLVRKVLPKSLSEGVADAFRYCRGWFWRAFYGFPGRGLKIIAVTGTNGKTTTVSFINEMLKSSGNTTAVLTTAYYEVIGKKEFNATHRTLGSQKDAQKFLRKARKEKVDIVVMEVTSHALVQRRVEGLNFVGVAITNLAQDHLDYHGTMEEYAKAKALAITDYKAGWVVLNASDEWFDFFNQRVTKSQKLFTFGESKQADIRLESYRRHSELLRINAEIAKKKRDFDIKLIGKFNVYNALAAYCVGLALGIEQDAIEKGLGKLEGVDGRMEEIETGKDFRVFVDYSYAADQLEAAIQAAREVASGAKVSVVFGATGDRDAAHWLLMGKSSKNADKIYVTDDETYHQRPEAIREIVMQGVESAGAIGKAVEVDDRKGAIKIAFDRAESGEIIILAGLGHQDYRNMGGKKLAWKEADVARKLLTKLQ